MKLTGTIAAAAIVALTFSSCEKKDNSHRETYPYYTLNYSTNGTSETYSIGKSVLSIEYIGEEGSSLELSGVVMPGGSSHSFSVPDLQLKGVSGGYALSSKSGIASAQNFKGSFLGSGNIPTFWSQWNLFYSFESDNAKIYGMPASSCYYSATSVTDPAGAQVLSTSSIDKNRYQISVNSENINTNKRTLNIYVLGAQFMGNMPAMNMVFQNIPFEIVDGRLTCSSQSLIPALIVDGKEVPNDKFPITNLSASGRFGEEMALNYSCTPTISTGNSITYTVSSTLKFFIPQTQTPGTSTGN